MNGVQLFNYQFSIFHEYINGMKLTSTLLQIIGVFSAWKIRFCPDVSVDIREIVMRMNFLFE